MRDAGRIPIRLKNVTGFIKLDDAAVIQIWSEPFIQWHLFGHPAPKRGLTHRKIERRRANADKCEPIIAV